jgi:hypothetical protein
MQLVSLATNILFTMAAAAMAKFNKLMIEVYYTNSKQIQKANYDYGRCVALQPQPEVWDNPP